MGSVWTSRIHLDSRFIRPMTSDVVEHKSLLSFWKGDVSKEPTGEWPRPTTIWVDEDYEGSLTRLPDLSSVNSHWIVSARLAKVLRDFDLGVGTLTPVSAFGRDRATPLAGTYLSWTFNLVKRAFLPDRSNNLRPFVRTVSSVRALIQDDDIACSPAALVGPDVWIDPGLYGSIFLSDRLVEALTTANLARPFNGPDRLTRCRIES